MSKRFLSNQRTRLIRGFSALVICALFVGHIPVAFAATYANRVHPILLTMADQQPDETVRIIVQELSSEAHTKDLVHEYGGQVVRDLRLISAYVAEIPARMVPKLGLASEIRWISPDAEVVKTSQSVTQSNSVRDEFTSASFAGNNGSAQWLATWSEIGESDGASIGDVKVSRYLGGAEQGLRIQGMSMGALRMADLGQASAASLNFTYRRKDFSDVDYVVVEATADGANWVELGRINGPATDESIQSASYDISALASSETTIRFITSTTLGERSKFYVDNVDIAYTRAPLPPAVFLPFMSSVQTDSLNPGQVNAANANGSVTVRDEFNQLSYANNDGMVNWASAWVETNDEGTPGSGNVLITNNELQIQRTTRGILRKVDLTNASTAALTFDYRRDGMDNANDYVALEIAAFGDPNWTELTRFAGPGSDSTMQSVTFDISSFASSDTIIRFVASYGLGSSDRLYVDNIEIVHNGNPDMVGPPSGGVTYTAPVDRDTWIFEDKPHDNYGHEDKLLTKYSYSGYTRRALLHYDIPSELIGCSAAAARAYFYDPDSSIFNRIGVHRLTSDWSEGGATWNNAPTFTPAPDATYTTPTSAQSYSIDVTAIAQAWLDGAPNYGLMLNTISESGMGDRYGSREGSSNHIPYLEIDAVCGAPVFIGANELHDQGTSGAGLAVAVVDSGIALHDDFSGSNGNSRIVAQVQFNNSGGVDDYYGHGTHVAGAIGGNGTKSGGAYFGAAPQVDLVDVKVTDDYGAGTTSDVIAGLQWIHDHKETYNIRVVNVSLNSTVAESYHLSPLNAALEILWFNGIVVVVSAGNNGLSNNGILFAPANDPFLITVGAVDDGGTPGYGDNVVASFSAYGTTLDGYAKPDLVAPGVDIISALASDDSNLVIDHPAHAVAGTSGNHYFRMSGTSMASAVMAGAVALLLQDDPTLTPDQVKYRLMTTAKSNWPGYDPAKAGAGLLDIKAAVYSNSTASANTGTQASQLLWTGNDPVTWGSVNWGSVNWGSVNWGSVNWGSVNWGSVNWGSVNWDD